MKPLACALAYGQAAQAPSSPTLTVRDDRSDHSNNQDTDHHTNTQGDVPQGTSYSFVAGISNLVKVHPAGRTRPRTA
jgi:hypothetical protein